jgi:hypothetical protein
MYFRGFHIVADGVKKNVIIFIDGPASEFNGGNMTLARGAETHDETDFPLSQALLVWVENDGRVEKGGGFHRIFAGEIGTEQ